MYNRRMIIVGVMAVILLSSNVFAQDSVFSEAKLYYNILNSEVYLTDKDLQARHIQPDLSLLPKLGTYLENPDENTRLYVFNIFHSLMQNAHNAMSRRELIYYILRGVTDKAENIRFATAKWLLGFSAEDFDLQSRKMILDIVKTRGDYPSTESYVILLAGHAYVKEAASFLGAAARTEDENLIRVKVSAYLALARMGDQAALTSFLRYFDAKKGTALLPDLLRDLTYTKQAKAINIVVHYLNDDGGILSSEENSISPYAAWYLSDIFRDFPVQMNEPKISKEDLEICRAWIRQHYDPDHLDHLLSGELQAWR